MSSQKEGTKFNRITGEKAKGGEGRNITGA